MKNTFKKIFISFTVLSLTACGSTTMQDNTFAAKENKDFTKYTNQLVVEYAENDYTTMHQFFEHPENYGIDILKALQLRPIPPDEVNLTPKLIRFNR